VLLFALSCAKVNMEKARQPTASRMLDLPTLLEITKNSPLSHKGASDPFGRVLLKCDGEG